MTNQKESSELVDVPETEGAVNSSLKDTFRDLIVLVHFPECERGSSPLGNSSREVSNGSIKAAPSCYFFVRCGNANWIKRCRDQQPEFF